MMNRKILFICMTMCSITIGARDRSFLKHLIPQNSIGAEIGVWKGRFSQFLLNELHPKQLHLIDPWKFTPDYPWAMYGGVIAKSQSDMDRIYDSVLDQFRNRQTVMIHRMPSSEAHKLFKDSYFDWIYIDGDHTYEGVTADLYNYFRKVKKGGLIIGDDFGWKSVKKAVIEFCQTKALKKVETQESQFIIYK